MTQEQAIKILQSGKTGTQILDLLDKVSTLCSVEPEENEFNDIEYAD